jgi:hypothetical protein
MNYNIILLFFLQSATSAMLSTFAASVCPPWVKNQQENLAHRPKLGGFAGRPPIGKRMMMKVTMLMILLTIYVKFMWMNVAF